MNENAERRFAKVLGRFFGHVAAVAGGLVFMIIGLGLGVTLVALPIGLMVGLGGLLLFLWGFFGHAQKAASVGQGNKLEHVPVPKA